MTAALIPKAEPLFAPNVGEYEHVPFREYLTWDLPSQSTLKAAANSPLHLKAAVDGESRIEATDEMMLGTAMHVAFLEPEQMSQHVVCWEGDRRAGAAWVAFCAEHDGKTILTEGFYARLVGMTRALRKHPVVRSLSSRITRTELSVVGDVFGTVCKGRIDGEGDGLLVDLKTCRSAGTRQFTKSAMELGYHVQAAHYCALMPGREFVMVAVENLPPHDVVAFRLDKQFMRAGEDDLLVYIQMYQECLRTGNWPGRSNDVVTLTLPEWAQPQTELTMNGEIL